jgi:hypothetical protein
MTAVRYPVAASAQAALSAPLGRAARASDAGAVAGGAVEFASELVGPGFATRDAALDAYAGRLDDEREGRRVSLDAGDRYLALVELAAPKAKTPAAVQPVYADGRRWPKAAARPPATVWRLSVRYWRVVGERPLLEPSEAPVARERKLSELDAKALRDRLAEPLRSPKPQKALDIGLFEFVPPDAPHLIIPDE